MHPLHTMHPVKKRKQPKKAWNSEGFHVFLVIFHPIKRVSPHEFCRELRAWANDRLFFVRSSAGQKISYSWWNSWWIVGKVGATADPAWNRSKKRCFSWWKNDFWTRRSNSELGKMCNFEYSYRIFFRKFANNKHCSPTTRHILTIIPGIGISLFCFGMKQTVYVLTIPTSCLIAFKVLPSGPASHFSLILPMSWSATIFWNRFMHHHPDVYPLAYSALTQFGWLNWQSLGLNAKSRLILRGAWSWWNGIHPNYQLSQRSRSNL